MNIDELEIDGKLIHIIGDIIGFSTPVSQMQDSVQKEILDYLFSNRFMCVKLK